MSLNETQIEELGKVLGLELSAKLNIRIPDCICECGASHKYKPAEKDDVIGICQSVIRNWSNAVD